MGLVDSSVIHGRTSGLAASGSEQTSKQQPHWCGNADSSASGAWSENFMIFNVVSIPNTPWDCHTSRPIDLFNHPCPDRQSVGQFLHEESLDAGISSSRSTKLQVFLFGQPH